MIRKSPSNSRIHYIVYLVAMAMLCAFGPVCTDFYLPALPMLMNDYQTDAASVQLSLTAAFLGLAIGQIFIGPLSDAYGRRITLLFSVGLFVITSLACAYAPTISFLVFMRFFQGFAGAGGIVLTRAIACDRFKGRELSQFMSLLMAIHSVAPILGPVAGSFVITFANWPVLFLILAGWGVLLCLLIFTHVPESLPKEQRNPKVGSAVSGMLKELVNVKFLLLTFSLSFVMAGFFGYIAASPFVFQIIYKLSTLQYSLVFGSIALFTSFAAFMAGRMIRRAGELKVLRFCLGLMLLASASAFCCSLIVPDSFIFIYLSLMVFCAMMGAAQASGFSVVMAAKKGGAGAASGLFGVMNFLFGAISSPFMGVMGENSMLPLGICLLGCTLLAIILCYIGVKFKSK